MGEERGRTASTIRPRDVGAPAGVEVERAADVHITPAKGSGQIHRDELVDDEMATREMDPGQFRALLAQESERKRNLRAPTIPATPQLMTALVAQTAVRDQDDDLAIPVEESKPVKPRAVIVEDLPRAVAPPRPASMPTAPSSDARLTALLVVLVLAIGGAVAYYVLTGRV